MHPRISQTLLADLSKSVDAALAKAGTVNIPLLAQEIQFRNSADNVALEDIASQLMHIAQGRGALMEFDTKFRAAG